jgi:hypothetical protein
MPCTASNFHNLICIFYLGKVYKLLYPFLFYISESKIWMIIKFIEIMLLGKFLIPLLSASRRWRSRPG